MTRKIIIWKLIHYEDLTVTEPIAVLYFLLTLRLYALRQLDQRVDGIIYAHWSIHYALIIFRTIVKNMYPIFVDLKESLVCPLSQLQLKLRIFD
ncbi:hypothetical protein NG99_07950 [Erwinia typographi]|uniref:Uncharacterized protein n=1 Tax=Erwinia typographi TaxID=371042 RepID=A0A0A3Z6S8_9GAMM|nr:hypothetical protein NG99_07950 [Erwinia typographi]